MGAGPEDPELLMTVPNTVPTLAWCLGTRIRMSTTTAAPATCHQTEMLLMTANRWLEKMFTSAAMARMPRKYRKIRVRLPAV